MELVNESDRAEALTFVGFPHCMDPKVAYGLSKSRALSEITKRDILLCGYNTQLLELEKVEFFKQHVRKRSADNHSFNAIAVRILTKYPLPVPCPRSCGVRGW